MINERLKQEQDKASAATPGSLILLGFRGSIAHGMYVPNTDPNSIDDIDLMGVVVPDKSFYYGLSEWGSRGTVEIMEGAYDIVLYDLRKMMSLLLNANPNVLSLLWLEKEYYLQVSESGRILIENRDLFMTKKMFPAFTGYAFSQLKKMESGSYEGYMGDKRKKLVEKYGYDCKNAAHLIRLLRMGIEAAETGSFQVYRKDAADLLSIKRGEKSLEWVKKLAASMFEQYKDTQKSSVLQNEPDYAKINQLCIQLGEISHKTWEIPKSMWGSSMLDERDIP